MKKSFIMLIVFISSVILTGCFHMPIGISPSSRPVDPNNIEILGHASGTSEYVSIFGLFPTGKPDFNEAIQNAIKKYPEGKTLINVRSHNTTMYLYIVTLHTLTVEGDVIK